MFLLFVFFFFKQKTAYEMRISDWSSDVCSSDLAFNIAPDQREGDVATEYRLDALIETLDDELDIDIEMLGSQLRDRGQRLLSERHVRRHPHPATRCPCRSRDHRFDAQHLPGKREHLRAQLGQPHGPGGSFD